MAEHHHLNGIDDLLSILDPSIMVEQDHFSAFDTLMASFDAPINDDLSMTTSAMPAQINAFDTLMTSFDAPINDDLSMTTSAMSAQQTQRLWDASLAMNRSDLSHHMIADRISPPVAPQALVDTCVVDQGLPSQDVSFAFGLSGETDTYINMPFSIGTDAGYIGLAGPLPTMNDMVHVDQPMAVEHSVQDVELQSPSGTARPPNTTMATDTSKLESMSPKDFEEHRQLISRLYKVMTLKQLKQYLEQQYKLTATDRMFKRKINKWGLDKKSKENEMKAMVRKYHRRAAQRKSTMFRIRGQDIQYSDIVRYCRRKRLSISDIAAQRAASKTPEAVVCLTPALSRVTTPSVLSLPEFLMSAIRDYINGCFDSGTWAKTEARAACYSRKDPFSIYAIVAIDAGTIEAHDLILKGDIHETEIVLDSIELQLSRVLLAEDPHFIRCLLRLLIVLVSSREGILIIKRLLTMVTASEVWSFGQQHPLRRTFEYFQSLQPSELTSVCTESQQVVSDQFEKNLGTMHVETLHTRIFSDQISLKGLRDIVRRCQAECGTYDQRTLTAHCNLGQKLYEEGVYAEARDACIEYIKLAYLAQEEDHDRRHDISSAHFLLAKIQRALHEYQKSEASIREAITLGISERGAQNSNVRLWILVLRDWLLEDGLVEEADEAWRWWKLLANPPLAVNAEQARFNELA